MIRSIEGDTEGQLNAKLRPLSKTNPDYYNFVVDLASDGQIHIFEHLMESNILPGDIEAYIEYLLTVDKACPDGLQGYIHNARKLLKGM